MKRNQIWNMVYACVLLITVVAEVLAVLAVKRLNMLPDSYMAVFIGVLALFALGIGLLLFLNGKRSGKGRRIAACVLAVVVICGCVALRTVALDIIETLQLTSSDTLEITTREIYVLPDDPAQDLADARDYTFGYVKDYDADCTAQVLRELQVQTGREVVTAGYTDILTMAEAFLENRVDAMIINGGIISILEDIEEFENFSEHARVLAQIRVFETNEASAAIPEQNENEPVTAETEYVAEKETEPEEEKIDFSELKPFAVYVSGSDSRDTEIVKNSRSDVNILAIVNPLTKQVLLVNTPRDYYIPNWAGGYQLDKLTHCGVYGTKCSMKTLGHLYGVDVEHFVRINFTGFKKMIDALGGITVYSDYEFMAIGRTPIQVGENTLDGQKALDFARERKRVPGGDTDRGRHQMKVITAVIEKATSGTTIINNYSEIMESVEGMFEMNVPAELISALMKMQLSEMARWNVVSFSATGYGDKAECYSAPGTELSVMKPNYSSVNKASRLIDMVFAGELLTEEVMSSIS